MSTTPDYAGLIDRLEGIYRIPITDGLGAVGTGEEPDNPNEFVRKFETAPIQKEAAQTIRTLLESKAVLEARLEKWLGKHEQQFLRAEAAEAERDRLAERVAELEAGLKPFAAFFEKAMEGFTEGYADRQPDDKPVWEWNDARLNMSHLRTARSLVKGGGDE